MQHLRDSLALQPEREREREKGGREGGGGGRGAEMDGLHAQHGFPQENLAVL